MLATAAALLILAAPPTPKSNEKAFKELLSKAKVVWTTPPPGLKEVPIEANRAMNYDYALRDDAKTLEVRIAVRLPQPPPPADPKSKTVMVPEENVFPALVQATMLNLSNGEAAQQPKAFSQKAVSMEFNADSGFTTFVEPRAEGWTAFKNCMFFAIRKAGAAEVYVFFLFDDFPSVEGAIRATFHLVKFK
ncbi:MAG: hypothetical protein QM817_18760 [Archangium sp.]